MYDLYIPSKIGKLSQYEPEEKGKKRGLGHYYELQGPVLLGSVCFSAKDMRSSSSSFLKCE